MDSCCAPAVAGVPARLRFVSGAEYDPARASNVPGDAAGEADGSRNGCSGTLGDAPRPGVACSPGVRAVSGLNGDDMVGWAS